MTPEKKRALEAIYDDARENLSLYAGDPAVSYRASLIQELIDEGYEKKHAEITIDYMARLGRKKITPLTP